MSPWASPVILVPKRDSDKPRMVIDYRKLNAVTIPLVYPIINIEDFLFLLNGSAIFAVMDVFSMYYQIEVEEDKSKTAFVTPTGHYEFNRMSFGLQGAPATSAKAVSTILADLINVDIFVYFDDILIFAKSFDELMLKIAMVLDCLRTHDLNLKPSKCEFAVNKAKYLGHEVSGEGIKPDMERVQAIDRMRTPKNVQEVKSILGMASFYRKFINDFAAITELLIKLIRKNAIFNWAGEQEAALQTLKKRLISPPVLAHFDPNAMLELRTDACGYAIGGVLLQHENNELNEGRVLQFMSRSLNKCERNYSPIEKEALAVIWCIGKSRHFLQGKKFIITTDAHSLCWLLNIKDPNGRIARWTLRLQPYLFEIRYRAGHLHNDADCLSRKIINNDRIIEDDFDEIPCYVIGRTTATNIKEHKKTDQYCQKIRKLLNDTELTKNARKRIMKKYIELNGLLYKRSMIDRRMEYLLLVPKSLLEQAIRGCHDLDSSGHFGIISTYHRFKKRFYAPKMLKQVKKYVQSCNKCQLRNLKHGKQEGLQKPIPVSETLFGTIFTDIFGPIVETEDKYAYVLVIVDQLSKYCVAEPLKNADSETTVKVLHEKWILKFGVPKVIVSDNGRNFVSEFTKSYFKRMGIIHKTSSPSHPQGHSPVERLIRTIQDGLSKVIDDTHRNWKEKLPERR
ncbi:pol polyprotein-like protein [Dinothrombium tinctorium]|uniref:RNA-directed DNA polymerase n=1 Tax=Dinothrombium tinctorium TaxID=1965070 RepID=A0A3S4Q972_9ACAR|nr:pol polyprotein-like protein [Dinothrombium tinctorium]